jgi:hypothetical protein
MAVGKNCFANSHWRAYFSLLLSMVRYASQRLPLTISDYSCIDKYTFSFPQASLISIKTPVIILSQDSTLGKILTLNETSELDNLNLPFGFALHLKAPAAISLALSGLNSEEFEY